MLATAAVWHRVLRTCGLLDEEQTGAVIAALSEVHMLTQYTEDMALVLFNAFACMQRCRNGSHTMCCCAVLRCR